MRYCRPLVFARLVREDKSTIYTVSYTFSHDEEEANDLFLEMLINMWKGIDSFMIICNRTTS